MSWRSLILLPAVGGDDWSRISTVRLSLDRRLIHVGGELVASRGDVQRNRRPARVESGLTCQPAV